MAAHLKIPLALVAAQLENDKTSPNRSGPDHPSNTLYIGFLLVVFFSPLIFSTAFYDFENIPRSLLIQAGALLIPTLWLLRQSRQSTFDAVGGPASRPLALLIAWALISLAWSTYRYGAFSQWIHWAACGLFYLIVFNLHTQRKFIERTLQVVMAATALAAMLGIGQYLYGLDWVPQQVVPAAIYNNKNMAAQVMVLAFPVGFVLAATSPSRKLTWLYALVTALVALFLFYTHSRAAWLGALVETVLIISGVWLYWHKSDMGPAFDKNRLLALVTALVILVVGIQLGPNSLAPATGKAPQAVDRKIGDNLDLSSGRHRVVLWKNTLSIIAQHPLFGVGIRNIQVHYPTTPDKSHHRLNLHTQRAHNDYLQMYAELGLPVLLVFVWLWFLIARHAVALIRGPGSSRWIPPALICLAAIAGLAINAFFSFPFNRALPPFLLAVYLGLFFKIADLAADPDGQVPVGRTLARKSALVVACVLGVVIFAWGYISYHWSQADHLYRKHLISFMSGDYPKAVLYGEKALGHNPNRGAILRSLSRAYVRQEDYVYEKAENLFARIDAVFPHSTLNLYHQAVVRINQKRYTEAKKTIKKGLVVMPQCGELYGLLGVVYQAEKQETEAIAAYRQAIVLSPEVASHYQWLGQMLYGKKRYDEAAPVLARWIEIEPKKVDGHVKFGLILLNRGESASAEGHFRNAVRLLPDSAILHRYLGVALINQERLDEAVEAFQMAILKSRGRDAAAYNNLGSALARQNQLDEAIDHFEAALKVDPDYAEARQNFEKARKMLSAQ